MPCIAFQLPTFTHRPPSIVSSVPSLQRPSALRHRQARQVQPVASSVLNESQQGVQVQREEVPHYAEGSHFLKSLGFRNASEISRVLDIAMNPNSLYLKDRHKRRSVNSSARRLSVQEDMQPVCQFLKSCGLSEQQIVEVVTEHPPVLSYSVDNRLKPFMLYLKEIGIAEPAKTVLQRPTLLGLDADKNLRSIVGYLQENGHSVEEICHMLQTTI